MKKKSVRPYERKTPLWKARLDRYVLPCVQQALREASLPCQAIGVDYRNGVIRILAEPESDSSRRKLIEATTRHGIMQAPMLYHGLGVVVTRCAYPYTVHVSFDKPSKLLTSLEDKIKLVTIKASELVSLRQAFDQLAALVPAADRVVTFALGGITALNYITRNLLSAVPQGGQQWIAQHAQMEQQFHLFGGISWNKHAPFNFNKAQFLYWLDHLPDVRQLLVFDASFSGSAINKLKKLFTEYALGRDGFPFDSVHLVGIRESEVPLDPEHLTLQPKAGQQVPLTVTYLSVPDLVTEDQNELIGYDALKQDDSFAAIGINALARVVDDADRCVTIAGGGDVAGSVQRWLRDPPRVRPLSNTEERILKEAAVTQILENQRDRERDAVMAMANRRVIDTATRDAELQRIEKRFQGAFMRERAVFECSSSSWRDSPKPFLHQLQQKGRAAAKRKRGASAKNHR